MRALTILLLWAGSTVAAAQSLVFRQGRMKVYHGDTVTILADSAWIIGQAQAQLINERLLALQAVQEEHRAVLASYKAVQSRIAAIEKQAQRLTAQLLLDNQLVGSHLELLLVDLDRSIAIIGQSNSDLLAINDDLRSQLDHLDLTVKHLKKENRALRWKHVRTTVGVGAAGLLVGFVVGAMGN